MKIIYEQELLIILDIELSHETWSDKWLNFFYISMDKINSLLESMGQTSPGPTMKLTPRQRKIP